MGPRRQNAQDGYALLVIMLALSVFVITLAQAVPRWATQIRREREARTIDYARQYREAIERYFHKNGRYPASLDVLAQHDASGLRYLRQTWQDPLVLAGAQGTSGTGSNGQQQDVAGWQVIHFGQAVTAEIVDQPPAAMASATGGIAGPNLTGSPSPGLAAPGNTPSPGTMPTAPGMTTIGTIGTTVLGTTATGLPGTGSPAGGGGGAIIGVAPLSKQPAVHAFNGFDIPNDWQFVYNYAQDPSLRSSAGATRSSPGVPPTASGAPLSFPPASLPPANNVPPAQP